VLLAVGQASLLLLARRSKKPLLVFVSSLASDFFHCQPKHSTHGER
jgi:hypothetical protein